MWEDTPQCLDELQNQGAPNIHVKAVRPLTFCLASACSRTIRPTKRFFLRAFSRKPWRVTPTNLLERGPELNSHTVNGKIFRIQCLDTPLFGANLTICVDGYGRNRLGYQPLFGKGARALPPKVLLREGRGPDTRERRKSSLWKKLWTKMLCQHLYSIYYNKYVMFIHPITFILAG